MVGAIGEILGAFGVIATLGYLAIQLRANTQAMRQAGAREAFDGTRILLAQLSGDAELARIMRIGLNGMDALDPDEATRFGTFMLSNTYNWLRVHSFEKDRNVEAGLAEATRMARRDIVSAPGYRQWYELRKHWLPEDFRGAIESDMAGGSGRYVPYGADGQTKTRDAIQPTAV
jgi:hypothetical protein